MPTAVDSWDEALFGCPVIGDYRAKREPAVEGRPALDGTSRYRRRQDAPITRFDLGIPQSQEQHQAWLAWHETTLAQGTEWFEIDLFLGTRQRTVVAHVVGDWTLDETPVGALWGDLSFTVETYDIESTAYEHPEVITIVAGTALDPSPVVDTIYAGTAVSPSPEADTIYGGDQVGMP